MNQTSLQKGRSEPSLAKPKLLIIELWGMGDLVIATPFLRAAREKFQVTLLAKPFAVELQARLWPEVKVVPFSAPWTAFKNKYRLWRWPMGEILRLRRALAAEHFEYGLSSRWDPRDHFLLQVMGVRHRIGFPRVKSEVFLTKPLGMPDPLAHHYEYWRVTAQALGISLAPREKLSFPRQKESGNRILVHSGARVAVRVWPLEEYQNLIRRLRTKGHVVQVACDLDQVGWWQNAGETGVICPHTVTELLVLLDQSAIFLGNDSGPGHLAAVAGLPTFTFFGPQLPEWFAPLHPRSEWIGGKSCPYKPCSDYCRFATPECLWTITADEVWPRVQSFVEQNLSTAPVLAA
jgi:ADP-heptose:LPS heptosyltransferase